MGAPAKDFDGVLHRLMAFGRRPRGLRVALLLLTLGRPRLAAAQAGDLALQGKVLLRALAYDRHLKAHAGDEVGILIVFRPDSPASLQCRAGLQGALAPLTHLTLSGLPVALSQAAYTTPAALQADVQARGADALVLCDGLEAQLGAIVAVARMGELATLTLEAAFVRQGVALGAAWRDGRVHLLVNPNAAAAHGMELAAELMHVAEAIGP